MLWMTNENNKPSHASEHLAICLHRIGARRERYYCGQMSGHPCILKAYMELFCELLFILWLMNGETLLLCCLQQYSLKWICRNWFVYTMETHEQIRKEHGFVQRHRENGRKRC